MNFDINELRKRLEDVNYDHMTTEEVAIEAFKFFHEMALDQVIDEDILKAILADGSRL